MTRSSPSSSPTVSDGKASDIANTQYRLRILHISDLHARGPRENESWRRRRVLGSAWDKNLEVLLADGGVDLVCFTGDLADWGKADEYSDVSEFIEALLSRLSLGRDRLFLVPGNHDIDRQVNQAVWSDCRPQFTARNAQELSRWLAGGPPVQGLSHEHRDQLLERQGAYRRWLEGVPGDVTLPGVGRPELHPKRSPHGHLGYRCQLRLPGYPFDLNVIGLDTSWLAGDDADQGHLWLTEDQLMRLCTGDKGDPLPGFRLVLAHHPFAELFDGQTCRRLVAEHADLVLRGHLHEPEPEIWVDPDRRIHQFTAGCLYEGSLADHHPNACHLIDAILDPDGHPLQFELHFRAWSAKGHWHSDDSLYRGSRSGRLTIPVPKAVGAERHSSIPSVNSTLYANSEAVREGQHIPPSSIGSVSRTIGAPPIDFTGREELLERLESSIRDRNGGCWVIRGAAGVGKSSLARKLASNLKAHFSGIQAEVNLHGEGSQPLSPDEVLGRMIHALSPGALLPKPHELEGFCYSLMSRHGGILLLDNVESEEQVSAVPQVEGWLVLITSRCRFDVDGFESVDVAMMTASEARALLNRICPRLVAQVEMPDGQPWTQADVLADRLGCYPLALRLAGKAIKERRTMSVSDYLRRLDRILPTMADEFRAAELCILTSLSFLNEEQRRLWSMLGVFADRFAAQIASIIWALNTDEAQEVMHQLDRFSLVEVDEEDALIHLHPLSRQVALRLMDEKLRTTAHHRHADVFPPCQYVLQPL